MDFSGFVIIAVADWSQGGCVQQGHAQAEQTGFVLIKGKVEVFYTVGSIRKKLVLTYM